MNSSVASAVAAVASALGLGAISGVVGAIAGAIAGSSVSMGNVGTSSPIGGTNTSDAADMGTGVDGSAAGSNSGLGGFGSDLGDNYGGGDGAGGGGAGGGTPQTGQPIKPPEPNPPTITPPGTEPPFDPTKLEERRRRNTIGWMDMFHNEDTGAPIYTPTAFEEGGKQAAVEKTTKLPSWVDTQEEKEAFYGGLFNTYGI